MTIRRYVAVALAVWMIWTAFAGLSLRALPPHVVAAGIFGPGNDVSTGTSNAANVVGRFAYYSTTAPGYTVLTTADSYTPADGTNPAFAATDVGAAWDWFDGDAVVVVVETLRGVGGWADRNFTTSVDGVLRVGATVQDFGNGTLEPLPSPTVGSGADWVDLSWTGLADAHGNVVSYVLYDGATSVATVNQGANPSHNATGLSAGSHCFTLSVNYRRDTSGGVFETVGRSEPVCRTLTGSAPSIVSTTPSSGAGNVALGAGIEVQFSEAIDTVTLTYQINPALVVTPVWSVANTRVNLTHGGLTQCTVYTVTITQARDVDGNSLVPGPVPNPWSFTTICPAPYIVSTVPVAGATGVPRATAIRITFSEAIQPATFTYISTPALASPSALWSGGNTVVTISHTGLQGGGAYTFQVTGAQDLDGNSLVPGPVPNPFGFTANTPPTALLTAPGAGVCRTGSADLTISWTMSDPETGPAQLRVWLNYTDGVTTTPIPGIQGTTGHSASDSFAWSTPLVDVVVQIRILVLDGSGDSATGASPDVQIDSTPPTATLTQPTPSATNVPTNLPIRITFSEPMDKAATEAAFSITPAVAGLVYAWSNADSVLWINHSAFSPSTAYAVTVGTGARDDCSPGLALAAALQGTFNTGAGARVPGPPTGVQVSSTTSAISVSWVAPTTWSDGTALNPSVDLSGYKVYRSPTEGGTKTEIGNPTTTSFTDPNVVAGNRYCYWVTALDATLGESDFSSPAQCGTVPTAGAPGLDPLVVIIPIAVVLGLVGLFLLLRRKKSAPSEAPAAPASEPGRPAGETQRESGEPKPTVGGETDRGRSGEFISCPNCGTMVKPTDAECFVCGTKL